VTLCRRATCPPVARQARVAALPLSRRGHLARIGRHAAIADLRRIGLTGFATRDALGHRLHLRWILANTADISVTVMPTWSIYAPSKLPDAKPTKARFRPGASLSKGFGHRDVLPGQVESIIQQSCSSAK
jgi:hypothetical protein